MKEFLVTKRSGKQEPIDLDKIHRVLDWAAKSLDKYSDTFDCRYYSVSNLDGIRFISEVLKIILFVIYMISQKLGRKIKWLINIVILQALHISRPNCRSPPKMSQ